LRVACVDEAYPYGGEVLIAPDGTLEGCH